MKLILAIAGILLVALFTVLIHYGLFADMTLEEKTSEPLYLVYESHLGDYSKTPQVINKVFFTLLMIDSIKTSKGFGIYFDNPEFTPKQDLRWVAGSILEEKDTALIPLIREKFNVIRLEGEPVAETTFEYKGRLSVIMGIYKAYPVIGTYIRERELGSVATMEIYDQPGKVIRYRILKSTLYEQFSKVNPWPTDLQ